MNLAAVKLITAIALPVIVFLGGTFVMSSATGRQCVTNALKDADPGDQPPLHVRLGYSKAAVDRHWRAIMRSSDAMISEQHFLKIDLFFPVFYGAALVTSLLMVWEMLGRPFSPAWILAPVAITAVADWTENLVQLAQLARFTNDKPLQASWIQLASLATILKLVFFTLSSMLIGAMVVASVFWRPDNTLCGP